MAAGVGGIGHIARRWGLLVAAAVVLTSLFPALAPAQTSATVSVTGGSWYWMEQVGTVQPPAGSPLPPVAPPGALPTPDVPAGDFPVAVVGGQPDKESFLLLDSSAIVPGSTVHTLVLTLHEDPNASGKLNPDTATIEARAVTGFMAGGAQGAPWVNRPAYDTIGPAVPGKRAPDGTWTFELAPIAAGWASGDQSNNGLALVPATPQQGQSYEVVWFGPGGAQPPTTLGIVDPPSPGSPQAQESVGVSASADQSAGPVSITPDASGAGLATASPSIASTPTAAGSAPAPTAQTPTRVRAISSHRAPPWGFYLAILAVIALIGASTLSLGDLGEPEPERQGGVLRTLERRTQEVRQS